MPSFVLFFFTLDLHSHWVWGGMFMASYTCAHVYVCYICTSDDEYSVCIRITGILADVLIFWKYTRTCSTWFCSDPCVAFHFWDYSNHYYGKSITFRKNLNMKSQWLLLFIESLLWISAFHNYSLYPCYNSLKIILSI